MIALPLLEPAPYVRPTIPPATLADVTGEFPPEPWLAGQAWLVQGVAPLLASPSSIDRLIGLGRLARLSTPAPSREALEVLRRSPDGTISRACRRWLDGAMTADAAAWAGVSAALSADALFDSLDDWLDDWLDAPPDDLREMLPLAHWRDDLESVSLMLRGTLGGEEIGATLRRLDDNVDRYQSVLVDLDLDDDRLSAVSWVEPHAWWGLAGS